MGSLPIYSWSSNTSEVYIMHEGSGRFGGDMDRNEVEMELNKFMSMIQEIGELKDKIRELEGRFLKTNNTLSTNLYYNVCISSYFITE